MWSDKLTYKAEAFQIFYLLKIKNKVALILEELTIILKNRRYCIKSINYNYFSVVKLCIKA
jgi:hypothetical protein